MFVRRLAAPFGAEIIGLCMKQFRDPSVREELRSVLFENLLVVLRTQTLSPPDQVDLTRQFGEPEIVSDRRHPESSYVQEIVSTSRPLDAPRSASQFWHTDGSFRAYPPIATVLRSVRTALKFPEL